MTTRDRLAPSVEGRRQIHRSGRAPSGGASRHAVHAAAAI